MHSINLQSRNLAAGERVILLENYIYWIEHLIHLTNTKKRGPRGRHI